MCHVFGRIVDCWRVDGFTYTNGFNLMASIGLETKLLIISILTKSYPLFPQEGRILFMADNQRDGLQGSIFKYHACAPKRPIVIEIND